MALRRSHPAAAMVSVSADIKPQTASAERYSRFAFASRDCAAMQMSGSLDYRGSIFPSAEALRQTSICSLLNTPSSCGVDVTRS